MKISKNYKNSDKKFGFFFTFIFFVLACYFFFINKQYLAYLTFFFSGILLKITLYNPRIINKLKNYWIKFGIFLGKIVNPIILAVIFFGIFTAYSIIMKIFGRDELNLNKVKKNSYWRYRNKKLSLTDFNKQF